MQRRTQRPIYQLFPLLLLSLFLFTACGDLEGSGTTPDPGENVGSDSAAPTGVFGVSLSFGGPYLNDVGEAITSADDERVVEVEPGGKFYVRVDYEDPSGITDIDVNLVNESPEGLAGTLDPTQSFFTLGQPTNISEPSGCDLSERPTSVVCIYEVRVAEDAVNITALENSADEFAYVFRTQVTDAAGNTSDEAERGYVVIEGDEDGEDGQGETPVCTNPVNISDEALRTLIRESLGLEDADITCENLAQLTSLYYDSGPFGNISIESLEGLQYALNLEIFSFLGNALPSEAFAPIQNLTSLETLTATVSVADENTFSFVENLVNLKVFVAVPRIRPEDTDEATPAADLRPFRNLTELTDLNIAYFNIDDIGPLQNLTKLTDLTLNNNSISNLSPLQGLTKLTSLELGFNQISDVSPLQNLTNLTQLGLSYNQISDISPLQNLTSLVFLFFTNNQISDIGPLQNLINLTDLSLVENNIGGLDPLVANEGLADGDNLFLSGTPLNLCPGSKDRADIDTLIERGVSVLFDQPENCDGEGGEGDDFIRITTTSGAASLDDECTLRAAITAANTDTAVGGCSAGDGADTVVLSEGDPYTLTEVDNETEGANGLPAITSEITLEGNGAIIERQRQEGVPTFRLVYVAEEGNLSVDSVTLQGGTFDPTEQGSDFRGGGVLNTGILSVSASTLQENGTDTGVGALYNQGTATLEDSLITKNAGFPAGIYNDADGTITIDNTRITDQNDEAYGMENKGRLVMTGGELSGNSDSSCCSAFTNYEGASATFDGTRITGNGGQGSVFNNGGEMELVNVTYRGNASGVRNGGTLTVTKSIISNNDKYGISNIDGATLTLVDSTISGNGSSGYDASGVANSGTAEIVRSTVQGNGVEADDYEDGGVGLGNSGTLILTESTVSGNSGGGILNSGSMEITTSTVRDNGPFVDGIVNLEAGTLTVMRSLIDGNGSYGVVNGGGLSFTNNTVTNNYTGGIKNLETGELEVAFSSIFGASSGFVTSISNEADAASVTVFGTILDTEFDFDCGPNSVLTSRGYNFFVSDEPCSFNQDTDIVSDTYPELGPLQDNGGPTLTRALEADGEAVDYIPADVCNVETDQRGVSRPQGEACDIGAFELEQ